MRRVVLALLTSVLVSSGCYLSFPREHDLEPTDRDGSVRARDASDDAWIDDVPAQLDAGPGCPIVDRVVDVARGGCEAVVIESTEGNVCAGFGETQVARVVRLRRERPGDWAILIRSRGIAEGTIGYGFVRGGACDVCMQRASASGGDLRLSGVGGDMPSDATMLDVVLDAQDGAMWMRVCDLDR